MASNEHNPDHYTMSFGDHLEELRRRLLWGLALPIPLSVVTFLLSNTLIEWLLLPLYNVLARQGLKTEVVALSPPEILVTKIKLSIIAAIIVSTPWLLWQVWRFIAPGLYGHERRFVYFLIPGSFILTITGVALMYFVMLPLMLTVLVSFGARLELSSLGPDKDTRVLEVLAEAPEVTIRTVQPEDPPVGSVWLMLPEQELYVAVADDAGQIEAFFVPKAFTGRVAQTFRVSYVINFELLLMLAIAIAFQMPLVILLLGWLGLVSPQWLRSQRKYALFICGIVAAIITPADIISMLAMLLPLYGLYELGILLLMIAPASNVAEGSLRWPRKKPPEKSVPREDDDAR
jgi:sec-independent protein translocase protein TatC